MVHFLKGCSYGGDFLSIMEEGGGLGFGGGPHHVFDSGALN